MADSEIVSEVVATGFGGPEVLSVVETPIGHPGGGEVRLEVRAAGTNPIDYREYSGAFGRDPERLPMGVGREAAGVVVAVGDGADGPAGPIHPGDEVVAYPIQGGYATE